MQGRGGQHYRALPLRSPRRCPGARQLRRPGDPGGAGGDAAARTVGAGPLDRRGRAAAVVAVGSGRAAPVLPGRKRAGGGAPPRPVDRPYRAAPGSDRAGGVGDLGQRHPRVLPRPQLRLRATAVPHDPRQVPGRRTHDARGEHEHGARLLRGGEGGVLRRLRRAGHPGLPGLPDAGADEQLQRPGAAVGAAGARHGEPALQPPVRRAVVLRRPAGAEELREGGHGDGGGGTPARTRTGSCSRAGACGSGS